MAVSPRRLPTARLGLHVDETPALLSLANEQENPLPHPKLGSAAKGAVAKGLLALLASEVVEEPAASIAATKPVAMGATDPKSAVKATKGGTKRTREVASPLSLLSSGDAVVLGGRGSSSRRTRGA